MTYATITVLMQPYPRSVIALGITPNDAQNGHASPEHFRWHLAQSLN